MKKIIALWFSLIVVLFIEVGCNSDKDDDATKSSGYYEYHLVDKTGSFDYSLDLGKSAKNVYFVFTNSSVDTVSEIPTVSKQFIDVTPGGSERTVDTAPVVPLIKKDIPEISDFNHSDLPLVPKDKNRSDDLLAPDAPRFDIVGDSLLFYVSSGSVTATCKKVVSADTAFGTKTLNVWVADNMWDSSGSVDGKIWQSMVDSLADHFLKAGSDNDIYDWVTNIYGAEWGTHSYSNLISADNQITILLYDIATENVAGFFHSLHNFTDSYASTNFSSSSNERVMFFIDAPMFAQKSGNSWEITDYYPSSIVGTLAHEFQHMINFYQKPVLRGGSYSDRWLDEMCSESTEDLVAYKLGIDGPRGVTYDDPTAGSSPNYYGRIPYFNYTSSTSVTDWEDGFASYSAVYTFGAFLSRNYGGAWLFRNIVQNALGDYTAVEYAIAQSGNTDDFTDALRKWGIAVLVSDKTDTESGFSYNNGGSWVESTIGSTTYSLGSINFFNYQYDTQEGPKIYTSLPTGTLNQSSNLFYQAASGASGSKTWKVSLPANVYLSVVVKE